MAGCIGWLDRFLEKSRHVLAVPTVVRCPYSSVRCDGGWWSRCHLQANRGCLRDAIHNRMLASFEVKRSSVCEKCDEHAHIFVHACAWGCACSVLATAFYHVMYTLLYGLQRALDNYCAVFALCGAVASPCHIHGCAVNSQGSVCS